MSKTTVTIITALLLALVSLGLIISRQQSLGSEIDGTPGDAVWKVTIVSEGELNRPQSTVTTRLTPDFRKQHITDESFTSQELTHRIQTRKEGGARKAIWRQRPNAGEKRTYHLEYSFRAVIGMRKPTPGMQQRSQTLDAIPRSNGPELRKGTFADLNEMDISGLAAKLDPADPDAEDRVRALFDHVAEMPSDEVSNRRKTRVLVALCRELRIPGRIVTGLILRQSGQQELHTWGEAWVDGHWLPMDPSHGHFGLAHFPRDYLVLGLGDDLIKVDGGKGQTTYYATDLHFSATSEAAEAPSAAKRFWRKMSLYQLRPEEQQWVRFLLLLPVAALVVCVCRAVIGINTYGTFGPALLGLVCRDLHDFPWVMGSFLAILMAGWGVRILLDRYHLLMVPRLSALLTVLVVLMLATLMILGPFAGTTHGFLGLLPLIILVHIIERFWTVDTEDGTGTSLKTLLGTVGVAIFITLVVHVDVVVNGLMKPLGWDPGVSSDVVGTTFFRHPEALGLVLAGQLMIGRYTGYRLTELFRFQDVLQEFPAETKHEPVPANLAASGNGHPGNESPQHGIHSGPQPALAVSDGGQQEKDARPVPEDGSAHT